MRKAFLKTTALILCLAFCALLLPACGAKADPLAHDGFRTLELDARRGTVSATVTLSARTLQKKTGQTAFLYELLPGETAASLTLDRDPLDQARIGAQMKFRFDLYDGERTRLYSTFTVIFEDGTPMLPSGYAIENPQALASTKTGFLWSVSPKGLFADDAASAASMGARHTAYFLSFSDLLGEGADTDLTLGDTSLRYASSALATLDGQIKQAFATGMQVSLSIIPDLSLTSAQSALILDMLAARYSTEASGIVSAILIQSPEGATPASTAELCLLASLALRSRVADGRIYVAAPQASAANTKAFFNDLRLRLLDTGSIEWGACLTPVLSLDPEVPDTADTLQDAFSISELSDVSAFLLASNASGRASYIAVCPQVATASSEDTLAASFAYAYRQALSASASLILYPSHKNDETGILLSTGEKRPLTSVFCDIDTGLGEEDLTLCSSILGERWTSLPAQKSTRSEQTMAASLGYGSAKTEPLYDFTDGTTHGFVGLGSLTEPVCRDSAVFGAPVLYTWLNSATKDASGVCRVMKNGEALRSAVSMTVSLLAQAPDSESCVARLCLEGVSKDGKHLSYESSVELRAGLWQAVTFQISDFVSDADLSKPCVLTLTTEPTQPTDEEYVLWIGAFDLVIPHSPSMMWLPIALILGGAVLGFLCVLLIYRLPASRRKNTRRGAGR